MTTFLLYLKAFLLSLSIFILPIKGIMIFVIFAIFMDTAFGLWASKKLKKPIISGKLFRFATKSLIYLSVIFLFFGVDLFMFGDLLAAFGVEVQFALTKIVGLLLIGIESFSIDEKIQNVYGNGKGIFFWFRKLVGAVKEIKKGWDELDIKKD